MYNVNKFIYRLQDHQFANKKQYLPYKVEVLTYIYKQ